MSQPDKPPAPSAQTNEPLVRALSALIRYRLDELFCTTPSVYGEIALDSHVGQCRIGVVADVTPGRDKSRTEWLQAVFCL